MILVITDDTSFKLFVPRFFNPKTAGGGGGGAFWPHPCSFSKNVFLGEKADSFNI